MQGNGLERPSFKEFLAIWWLLIWRASAIAFAIGLATGAVVSYLISTGVLGQVWDGYAKVFLKFVILPVDFVVLHMMFAKRFKGFRICIVRDPVALDATVSATAPEPEAV
jgi:hypothetical protein